MELGYARDVILPRVASGLDRIPKRVENGGEEGGRRPSATDEKSGNVESEG